MIVAGHKVEIAAATDPIYNGFDCAATYQINDARVELRQNDDLIYRFERALQGVVMEMTLRGFLVDMEERENAIRELGQKRSNTWTNLSSIISAIGCNFTDKLPNSGKQLQHLFYEIMGLPPIKKTTMGETKFPMDRATLEKLELSDKFAAPIINGILNYRDLGKSLQVLETEIDRDWRWRCSYNIAGTKTGRFSSSKSPFMIYNESDQAWRQTGNNFQNISEILRRVFIPDPGYKLYGIDKAQSEARDVGWFLGTILGDWRYLDACESGDLHTSITRLLYPEWDWTGNLKTDRALAERRFYRLFTYRDASKRLGHACLTEDHEVLTPNGWVPITEKPSTIMQFNRRNNISSFSRVLNWTDTIWNGDLYEWNGRSLSIKMNAPHRVLYTTTDNKGFQIASAKDVPNSARIPLGWGYIGGEEKIPISIARIIAAYQCDGYIGPGSRQIRFHMKKERKFAQLEKLAQDANLPYSRNGDRASIGMGFYDFWPKRSGSYLLNWSLEALIAYLDELPNWDGYEGPTYKSLSSKDRDHLEWIQTCNRLVGIGGNIQKPQMSGFGSMVHSLQFNNREYCSLGSAERTKTTESVRVLCPTVDFGFFYVRRNGRISITGNSNYMGEPFEISRQTRIPLHLVQEFQDRYFAAFPIREMHQAIIAFLQTERYLINSFGRRRDFFDRPTDRETWKSAVAYMFQSATADAVNLGLYRLWKNMGTEVQILSQLHDAVYFQYPICSEKEEFDMLEKALNNIQITQHHKSGRTMTIPGEIVGGLNWAHRYRLLADGTKDDWNQNGLDGIRLH